MTNPFIVLDIGATLVLGPNQGPASRLAAAVGLSCAQRDQLHTALMTHPWERPQSVVEFLRDECQLEEASLREAVTQIWSSQESEAVPIDGAQAVVGKLVRAGFHIGIISNIWHPFLLAARKHIGRFLDDSVRPEDQIYSYRQGVAKPSREIFSRALAAAGVQPCEAVMIGDSYREDIEPAAELGLNTIWLLHRPQKEASSVIRILNGTAPRPCRTLLSIAELEPQLIRAVLCDRGGASLRADAARAAATPSRIGETT